MKMSRQMKYKTKEKSSWTKRIFLWMERHIRIGQILDTSVLPITKHELSFPLKLQSYPSDLINLFPCLSF